MHCFVYIDSRDLEVFPVTLLVIHILYLYVPWLTQLSCHIRIAMNTQCFLVQGNVLITTIPILIQFLFISILQLDIARVNDCLNDWSAKTITLNDGKLQQAMNEKIVNIISTNMSPDYQTNNIAKLVVQLSHSDNFLLQMRVINEWNTFITHYKSLIIFCCIKCIARITYILFQFAYFSLDWLFRVTSMTDNNCNNTSNYSNNNNDENTNLGINWEAMMLSISFENFSTFFRQFSTIIIIANPLLHIGWLIEWSIISLLIGKKHYFKQKSSVYNIACKLFTQDVANINMKQMDICLGKYNICLSKEYKFPINLNINDEKLHEIMTFFYKCILFFIFIPSLTLTFPFSILLAIVAPLFVGTMEAIYSTMMCCQCMILKNLKIVYNQAKVHLFLKRISGTLITGIVFILAMILWLFIILTMSVAYTNEMTDAYSFCYYPWTNSCLIFSEDMEIDRNPIWFRFKNLWIVNLLILLAI